jgi:CBS domain-containing protein
MTRRIRLGESLVETGLITQAQLDEALNRRVGTGERIGEALVALGYISERDLLRTLAQDADIPFLERGDLVVDPTTTAHIPSAIAHLQQVVPLRFDGRALIVAMRNPFDVGAIRALERSTGKPIRVAAADPVAISRLIEQVYGGAPSSASSRAQSIADEALAAARASMAAKQTPVVAASAPMPVTVSSKEVMTAADLADDIIRRGLVLCATDIHI